MERPQQQLVGNERPDSAVVLMGHAASAASDKRNKTIMNCFRDRTPGYARSSSRVMHQNGFSANARPKSGGSNLSLLKSTSTKDITRLMEETANHSKGKHIYGSSSSNSSADSRRNVKAACFCDGIQCSITINQLEKRIGVLQQDLDIQRSYVQRIETKLDDLNKRMEELHDLKANEKRKKTKKPFQNSTGSSGNIAMQPSKLVAWIKLSNFWKHRPSIQTLKEQNIYNDEPCFDTEIEMVLKHEIHKTVPKIVVDCCDLIEDKYRKSTEPIEGIYRQCGDYNKIQTLRFQIDAHNYAALRQPNIDIHTLTGVLKLFLREIKSPLVSTNEAKTFIGQPNQWLLTELPMKIDILKRLIRSLPEVNRDTMEYLFAHFNKLTKVPLQQISAETLSISISPSIFHTAQRDAHIQDFSQLIKETEILSDCLIVMIEYQSRIFE